MKRSLVHDEEGLGLVEIVVSMFMLALVAIAFLPFLIQSLTLTRSNATLATATQLLDDDLADLRGLSSPNCTALQTFRDVATTLADSARNVNLRVSRTFTCPTTPPATVAFTIAVIDNSNSKTIVSATTLVFVSP
jgi:hypothetical protein